MGSSLLIAAYICIATATAARGRRAGRGRDNLGIAAQREGNYGRIIIIEATYSYY